MNKTSVFLRMTTGVLTAVMLAGCSQQSLLDTLNQYAPAVKANETIAEDSKWINSSIDGAINADTPTNVKDDFYTAVNKDWILNTALGEENDETVFSLVGKQYSDNVEALMAMSTEDTTGLDPEVMSAESLIHIQSLVHKLVETAADTASRNAAGAEPLRPYIEKINSISTMDEMTDYLADTNGGNPFGLQLAYFSMEAPISDSLADNYTVLFSPAATLALDDQREYRDVTKSGMGYYKYNSDLFQYELQQLGYSEAEVDELLSACYRFEIKLARCLPSVSDVQDEEYYNNNDNVYDRAGLEELAGNYPVTTILDAYGVGESETFTVPAKLQMQELGRLYTEANLADMKAYFIVQTVRQAEDLLDETTAAKAADFQRQLDGGKATAESADNDNETTESGDSNNPLAAYYNNYVLKYMSDAYQQMYIAHYCTAAQKRDIKSMAEKIIAAFSDVVAESDWMSEETKAEAQAKLAAMGLHILYPDNLVDYAALSFADCNNLVDIVGAINAFQTSQLAELVNQPVNRSNWNMSAIPTMMVNAVYTMNDNSINICAALLSTEDFFSENNTYEQNLACLGTVLGHEVTHGFDTTGYKYDKNGRYNSWWTNEDQYAFDSRADALVKYYSALTPVSRGSFLDGKTVSGEAIADMGGVKFALRIAADTPDFDYDAFFRAYAEMWRCHRTYMVETMYSSDSHPTGMLRTNVTLMQFDEFQKTYDIQPGDGMYLPAEERITVW